MCLSKLKSPSESYEVRHKLESCASIIQGLYQHAGFSYNYCFTTVFLQEKVTAFVFYRFIKLDTRLEKLSFLISSSPLRTPVYSTHIFFTTLSFCILFIINMFIKKFSNFPSVIDFPYYFFLYYKRKKY